MSAPLLVPTTVGLDALLGRLREGGLQMAVVVNEYGGVDGLVTLEDLVEEIVGEVLDEHDGPDDTVTEEDGGWSVAGLLRPDEVERQTGIAVPEDEDYETIAGLIARELGRLPLRGDEVHVTVDQPGEDSRDVLLTVLSLEGLRVERVRISSTVRPTEEDRS